ncbi:hypothetical protein Phi18:3_gp065 [Cellulophaga phage phi18:3]|uniref:Uncharacterized protein n=1 Tax=Cellulophaga phage phi18:3 TaxID=1327983 RepID=S0A291_9CAUD|nr:hypothetical protein Phi18:3_gp065 [Cellulophaga phage phi18:3]AGO48577.1 hypothetical protein Phi18:3_gp065 [Cellulophaga phage phi18:3]
MSKTIMMYRTALFCQNRGIKHIVESFNKGEHIVDDNNDDNCYSILKD